MPTMSKPIHIVGRHNRGKTTLLTENILFLFQVRNMAGSYEWTPTKYNGGRQCGMK